MKFSETLYVETFISQEMERICQQPDSSIKKDGVEFDEEVEFQDGRRMVIQVCSTTNPSKESCWTQGVLFSKDGYELACTDVGESFLGEYHIYYDECEYIVTVEEIKK